MAYPRPELFDRLAAELRLRPSARLSAICKELNIDLHTASVVIRVQTGRPFRVWWSLERAAMAAHVRRTNPHWSKKQVAAAVGLTPNGLRRLLNRDPN
jgi:hypothetical protein